jgi:hypothetical protein
MVLIILDSRRVNTVFSEFQNETFKCTEGRILPPAPMQGFVLRGLMTGRTHVQNIFTDLGKFCVSSFFFL